MSSSSAARPEGRLKGRRIFLSASVPTLERVGLYSRVVDAHLKIEEAVVSLARAVFTEGGTLVFGGHPAISPLVAMVAGEYITPRYVKGEVKKVDTPIQIYQSKAFRGHLPDETLMMFRTGYATLHWTNAVNGERYDPNGPQDQPPCPQSLRHMRERMIQKTAPAAMVCIGGMDGVEREVEIFRETRKGAPIYVFGETGGAAALLARDGNEGLRVIDREILERLELLRGSRVREQENVEAPSESGRPVTPYPLIAQMLVEELVQLDDHGRR